MRELALPTNPKDLGVDVLNRLIARDTPGVALAGFTIVEAHQWGGGLASSAGRIVIRPVYADGGPGDLPDQLVIKVARTHPDQPDQPIPAAGAAGALYQTEVDVYTNLRPHDFLEAPRAFGGAYDPSTNAQLLILEDLRCRTATFASVQTPTSLNQMRSLLDQLAILHARFWNAQDLDTRFPWLQSHTKGRIHDQFNTPSIAPAHIANQIETEQFKREMVERIGATADSLFRQFQALQRHQAHLPQTVCHGDTHIGNTYILPGEKAGLLDWQLTSRGSALHDVSYVIATGLSVAQRRAHERDLLAYYRERLLELGVGDAPDFDTLWLEHRRAVVWGVYIGWLTTPVVNYGWEVSVLAHLRLMTAYEDLETRQAIETIS